MTEGLKPCPFCGSNDITDAHYEQLHYGYECDDCGAQSGWSDKYRTIEEECNDGSDPWFGEGITLEQAKMQAVEKWNRRANDKEVKND